MDFIFKPAPERINDYCKNTIAEFLGIEFIETGNNFLISRMPVNARTHQSLGMLNGGASCVLAETTGSLAANLYLNRETHVALGLDINANHLKAVKTGFVYAKALPIHVGSRTQIWEIKITDEPGDLVCIARLTMMIVPVNAETKVPNESKIYTNES